MYFRGHVEALESQIAFLKERLELAEREKREVEQAARVREDALLERLAKAEEAGRVRADALLDRVLAKNNVSPVAEPVSIVARPDIIAPYGVADADVQEAYRESTIREETQYIMNRDGCDEGTARAYAEQWYVAQFQVIK